ncbi:hypothetical protein RDI58_026732 [Solanum bulbocastanum]|uniref:Uncharacterized protein n=1 Tax=Solanum bulbocastanum TaxID=147425 RepID=A0AAN8T223_SOLBU
MCGEVSMVKIKKRKIHSIKSVNVEDDSPMSPVVGPFEYLTSELRVVKESMAKLPQGLGESSAGPRSYVPQCKFDAYISDKRKQKSQLGNLKNAYASLAKSHCELSIHTVKGRSERIGSMRKDMSRLHGAMMVKMSIVRSTRLMENIEAAIEPFIFSF